MTVPVACPAPVAVPAPPAVKPAGWKVHPVYWGLAAGAVVIGAVVWIGWTNRSRGPGRGFVQGNGRVEATEIDVATKLAGRLQEVWFDEGDFVALGQPLAQMQITVLNAQRDEARALSRQAVTTEASAEAQEAARSSEVVAAQAVVSQRESEAEVAHRRFQRTQSLMNDGALSRQDFDDDQARWQGAESALAAARAQVSASGAAVRAAHAVWVGARAGIAAADATVARIEADIEDSQLRAPRAGRIQYRIAQPGEVLAPGGKVLNLVDLRDVYLTFFLPELAAGRVAIGTEVRVILDAVPGYVIPATVSFIASVAQFTPKTVETASEREKLMFRVKARFGVELLAKHQAMVKTGIPGVAWVRLDEGAAWPARLGIKVPE
jgi:HlyD family secretion protein